MRDWKTVAGAVAVLGLIACGSQSPAEPAVNLPSMNTEPTPVFSVPTEPEVPVATENDTPTEPPAQSDGYTCKDGTISHAQHRQGACSHHGGVRS